MEVVSEPSHAHLPAKITLRSEASSFALAIDGAARCWATSDPAVTSVPSQTLSGVKPQSIVFLRGVVYPLRTSLPALFGLVFFTIVSPF